MQQLETDLNFISSLPDKPAMATSALKQEFDKAGNIIKAFINETLEAEIGTDIATCLATAKAYTDSAVGAISLTAGNISYDNTTSGLTADDVQEAIDEVKSTLSSAITSVVGVANSKIKYSDFAYSTETISGTLTGGASKSSTISLNKSGYYPLGIIGEENDQEAIDIRKNYISVRNSGSGTVTYKIQNEDYGNSRTYTIKFYILWVKVS